MNGHISADSVGTAFHFDFLEFEFHTVRFHSFHCISTDLFCPLIYTTDIDSICVGLVLIIEIDYYHGI